MEEQNYKDDVALEHEELDEEQGSKAKTIFTVILVAVLAVLAFIYNPSSEAHQRKVNEIAYTYERTHSHSSGSYRIKAEAPRALRNVEYHSLGIFSYTTVKDPQISGITTIGAFGYVHPMFDIR